MVTVDEEEEEEEGKSLEWIKWYDGEMETRNGGRDKKKRANARTERQSAAKLNRQLSDYQQR